MTDQNYNETNTPAQQAAYRTYQWQKGLNIPQWQRNMMSMRQRMYKDRNWQRYYTQPFNEKINPQGFNPGYQPSFWEVPRNVASVYNKRYLDNGKWVDQRFVESAYDYFRLANGTDDWTKWKYLNPSDPARSFLQSGESPPLEYLMPPSDYQSVTFQQLYQQAPEERDPNLLAQLSPEMQEYLNGGGTDAENSYAEWEANAPGWQKFYNSIISDPALSGVANVFPLAIGGLASGNPLGIAMGGAMLAQGYAQGKISEWTNEEGASRLQQSVGSAAAAALLTGMFTVPMFKQYGLLFSAVTGLGAGIYTAITGNPLNDEMLNTLDAAALGLERLLGTASQITGSFKDPETFGTTEEILANLEATWKASSIYYETSAQAPYMKNLPAPYNNWINLLPAMGKAWATITGNEEELAKIDRLIEQGQYYAEPGETFFAPGTYADPFTPNEQEAPLYTWTPELQKYSYAVLSHALRHKVATRDPSTNELFEWTYEWGAPGGISGQVAELGLHIALDPLNFAGGVEARLIGSAAEMANQPNLAWAYRNAPQKGVIAPLKFFKAVVWGGGKMIDDAGKVIFEEMGVKLPEAEAPKVEGEAPKAEEPVPVAEAAPLASGEEAMNTDMFKRLFLGDLTHTTISQERLDIRKQMVDEFDYFVKVEQAGNRVNAITIKLPERKRGFAGGNIQQNAHADLMELRRYAYLQGYLLDVQRYVPKSNEITVKITKAKPGTSYAETYTPGWVEGYRQTHEPGYYPGDIRRSEGEAPKAEEAPKKQGLLELMLTKEQLEDWLLLRGKTPLTNFEKYIAGLSVRGIPFEYDPQFQWKVEGSGNLVAVQNAVLRFFKPILSLNPEAQAMWALGNAADVYNLMASNYRGNLDTFVKAWDKISHSPAYASAKFHQTFMGSPVMYTLLNALKLWVPNMKDLVETYNGFKPQRDLLNDIAKSVKRDTVSDDLKPGVIVHELQTKETVARLYEELRNAGSASIKKKIESGEITPESLEMLGKVFHPEKGASWHPDQFMARELADSFLTSVEKWAMDAYHVPNTSTVYKLWDTLKKAQSIFLLNYNPAYLVNNVVNNMVSRLATGIFGHGYVRKGTLENFWKRIGLVPSRYYAGTGAAQNLPEGVVRAGGELIGRPFGEAPSRAGFEALRKDLKGYTGRLSAIRKGVDAIQKFGITNRLSQMMERAESMQAEYIACKQVMDTLWRSGENVPKMDKALKNGLINTLGKDAPKWLTDIVRDSYSKDEVLEKIRAGRPTFDIEYALDYAIKNTGMNKQEAIDVLSKGHILEVLQEFLVDVKDMAGLDDAFNRLRRHFADAADQMTADDLKNRAEQVRNNVTNGQFHAATQLLDELNVAMAQFEMLRWMEKDITRARDMDMRSKGMEWNQLRLNWKAYRINSMREWQRMRAFQRQSIDGILKAVGMQDDNVASYVGNITDIFDRYNTFYKHEDAAYDKFFEDSPNYATRELADAAYKKMRADLDLEYDEMQQKIMQINKNNGETFVKAVETQYGADAAELAQIWVDDMADYAEKRYKSFTDQRHLVEALPVGERRKAYNDYYYNEFLPDMLQHYTDQTAKGVNLFSKLRFNTNLVPQAAPKQAIAPESPLPPRPQYEPQVSERTNEAQTKLNDFIAQNGDNPQDPGLYAELAQLKSALHTSQRKDFWTSPYGNYAERLIHRATELHNSLIRRNIPVPDGIYDLLKHASNALFNDAFIDDVTVNKLGEFYQMRDAYNHESNQELAIRNALLKDYYRMEQDRIINRDQNEKAPYNLNPMPELEQLYQEIELPATQANEVTRESARSMLIEQFMNKDLYELYNFNVEEHVDYLMRIIDSFALRWAREHNSTIERWYAIALGDISKGEYVPASNKGRAHVLFSEAREWFRSNFQNLLNDENWLFGKKGADGKRSGGGWYTQANKRPDGAVDKNWILSHLTTSKDPEVPGSRDYGVTKADLYWMGFESYFKDSQYITLDELKKFVELSRIRIYNHQRGVVTETPSWNYKVRPRPKRWYSEKWGREVSEPYMRANGQWAYYIIDNDGYRDFREATSEQAAIQDMNAHGIEYTEDPQAEQGYDVYNENGEWMDTVYTDNPSDVIDRAARRHNRAKYGGYQVAGANNENYGEWAFWIPNIYRPTYVQKNDLKLELDTAQANLDRQQRKMNKFSGMFQNEAIMGGTRNQEEFFNKQMQLQHEYSNLEAKLEDARRNYKMVDRDSYYHSHFDENNLILHTRFNTEHTDVDGKTKVFFIEEIQSDWLQALRDIITKAPELLIEVKDAEGKFVRYDFPTSEHIEIIANQAKNEWQEARIDDPDLKKYKDIAEDKFNIYAEQARRNNQAGIRDDPRLVKLYEEYQKAKYEADNAINTIPRLILLKDKWYRLSQIQAEFNHVHRFSTGGEHPFMDWKGNTDVTRMGFEMMVQYAAEQGYKRIGWTTGDTQVQRWIQAGVEKWEPQYIVFGKNGKPVTKTTLKKYGYDSPEGIIKGLNDPESKLNKSGWTLGGDMRVEGSGYGSGATIRVPIDMMWNKDVMIAKTNLDNSKLALQQEKSNLEAMKKKKYQESDIANQKEIIESLDAKTKELKVEYEKVKALNMAKISSYLSEAMDSNYGFTHYAKFRRENFIKAMMEKPSGGKRPVLAGFETIYDDAMSKMARQFYEQFEGVGTAKKREKVVDPNTGEFMIDPNTGEFVYTNPDGNYGISRLGEYSSKTEYNYMDITDNMIATAQDFQKKNSTWAPYILASESGKPKTRKINDPEFVEYAHRNLIHAFTTWDEDGRAIISALSSGEISTAIHEFVHVFERDISADDRAICNDWFKHLGLDAYYTEDNIIYGKDATEATEALAYGAEIYLEKGEFPNTSMKWVFDKLCAWVRSILVNVQKSMRPDVTPEMAEVYGRMMNALDERLGLSEKPTDVIGQTGAGMTDDLAPMLFRSQSEGELWKQSVEPLIDGMQDSMRETGMTGGYQISPELMPMVNKYLDQAQAAVTDTKSYAVNYANAMRDWALLNYSERRGFDNMLNIFYPYQFWYTRTAYNWLQRAVDKPAWFANFYRLRKFMHQKSEEEGYPNRMHNKMGIYAPFLPDWTGDQYFIDPMNNLFPPENYWTPIREYRRAKTNEARNAEYILQRWVDDETITQEEAYQAAMAQTGELWDKALATAEQEGQSDAFDPLGYLDAIMSPAMYITYPYYFATGKTLSFNPRPDMPLLPMSRTGIATEAILQDTPLEQLGQWVSDALQFPEQMMRKGANTLFNTNMSEYGDWGEYYIERQIANMVQTGEASLEDAKLAMIDNRGAVWNEAKRRATLEVGMRVPGTMGAYALTHGANALDMAGATLMGLAPAGLLPPAELETKQLKDNYEAARNAYNKGDLNAMNAFFEQYPEYAARTALFAEPEDRLRNFLITQIWNAWGQMGSVEHEQVIASFGRQFDNYFVNKETRNYDAINDETLAFWASQMGGMVPETIEPVTPEDYQPSNTPQDLMNSVQIYRDVRNDMFPNWYALQQRYYALPEGSQQRRNFLAEFPMLKDYWDWNKSYKEEHPEIELYTDVFAPQEQYDYSFMSEFSAPLLTSLYQYYLNGTQLSEGALSELNRIYILSGNQGGSFNAFIEDVIKPYIAP